MFLRRKRRTSSVRTGRPGMTVAASGCAVAADRPLGRTRPDLAGPGPARSTTTPPHLRRRHRYRAGPDAIRRSSPGRRSVRHSQPRLAATGHHHPAATRRHAHRQFASTARLPRRRPATHAAASDHRAELAATTAGDAHSRSPPTTAIPPPPSPPQPSTDSRRAVCLPRADHRPSRTSAGAHDAGHRADRSRTAPGLEPCAMKCRTRTRQSAAQATTGVEVPTDANGRASIEISPPASAPARRSSTWQWCSRPTLTAGQPPPKSAAAPATITWREGVPGACRPGLPGAALAPASAPQGIPSTASPAMPAPSLSGPSASDYFLARSVVQRLAASPTASNHRRRCRIDSHFKTFAPPPKQEPAGKAGDRDRAPPPQPRASRGRRLRQFRSHRHQPRRWRTARNIKLLDRFDAGLSHVRPSTTNSR